MNLDNKQKYLYKIIQAVDKNSCAALCVSFVIAAYYEVRRIPRDCARGASWCFWPACEKQLF